MKIEAGKYYINRSGQKVGPLQNTTAGDEGGFYDPKCVLFRSNGIFGYGDNCFCEALDLVEEWVEPQSDKAKLSGETIDMIALDSLKWHMQDGDMEPLQMEAFRIVLRYYGVNK